MDLKCDDQGASDIEKPNKQGVENIRDLSRCWGPESLPGAGHSGPVRVNAPLYVMQPHRSWA